MNAIVPLNVVALRVNRNDEDTITSQFRGATAAFDRMPWLGGITKGSNTGDAIIRPLDAELSPQNALQRGIHVHAELPDYFRRGTQPPQYGAPIEFPRAPNRFLVTRYLSVYENSAYQPVSAKSWIVEGDYVASNKPADGRPVISVPLPAKPALEEQPYKFMGRVVDYEKWNPATEPASDYLPSYKGIDGQELYLTSVGFAGADFAAYYPESISVFGFWDTFADQPAVYQKIKDNSKLQFKASYQVIGWVQDATRDPLYNIGAKVKKEYDDYVAQCAEQKVAVEKTPAMFFVSLADQSFRWIFQTDDIPFTVNSDTKLLESLTVPERSICAGITQEIVWNMLDNPAKTFLGTGKTGAPVVWQETVELAAGNTTVEALSALLKYDVGDETDDPDVLKNYELLLDALQLGLLHGLEDEPNISASLGSQVSQTFSRISRSNWPASQPA